jgi:hypothetical protein
VQNSAFYTLFFVFITVLLSVHSEDADNDGGAKNELQRGEDLSENEYSREHGHYCDKIGV